MKAQPLGLESLMSDWCGGNYSGSSHGMMVGCVGGHESWSTVAGNCRQRSATRSEIRIGTSRMESRDYGC